MNEVDKSMDFINEFFMLIFFVLFDMLWMLKFDFIFCEEMFKIFFYIFFGNFFGYDYIDGCVYQINSIGILSGYYFF